MHTTAQDPILAPLWQRFAAADCCWFSTVRPDGRAHLAPIWHVCHDQIVYVVTQPDSVRARNIAQNAAVSVALPDPLDVLIIEGQARVTPTARAALRPLFQEKYDWDIGSDTSYTTIIAVIAHKIMAWGGVAEIRCTIDPPAIVTNAATQQDTRQNQERPT